MDTTSAPAPQTEHEPDTTRPCTRCDGQQHLVSHTAGMGKYRCDTCELTVGFDLEADPAEFLLHRGQPGAYTQDVFGAALLGPERRL